MIDASRLALAAVMFSVLLSGCGGGGDTAPEVKPAPDTSAREAKLRKRLAEAKRDARAAEKKAAEKRAEARTVGQVSGSNQEIDSMLAALPGQAGLVVGAPGGDGTRVNGGVFTVGPAWSTIKVPIAERVLADAGGPGGLTAAQSGQITAAITLSDNAAAAALFDGLEADHGGLEGASTAVGETLRQAGDTQTSVSTVGRGEFTTYGQTEWSLDEQNRYMAALAGGCVSDATSRDFLLEQMSNVTADLWGLGSAGVPARWKGGWGPGVDGKYLVRQMGVLTVGGKDMVVTLAAIPDDGSFESGQAMATEIATWAVANLAGETPSPAPC